MATIISPAISSAENKNGMEEDLETVDLEAPEIPIIEISDSEDQSSSTTNETEKEESPEHQGSTRPSISTPTVSNSKKRKSTGSGKRKNKRVPCHVCHGRFGTQANLELHMKMHWNVFDKMDESFKCLTNRTKNQNLNKECKCSRCNYEAGGRQNGYEIEKNFFCNVCKQSFFTANKLSKHMDKHRDTYSKMKKLEEENHFLFSERRFPIENPTVDPKTEDECYISSYGYIEKEI